MQEIYETCLDQIMQLLTQSLLDFENFETNYNVFKNSLHIDEHFNW